MDNALAVTILTVLVGKMLWEFVQSLKKPSNEEVKEITQLEGRVAALEEKIQKKVDNNQWEERSAKFDAFLVTINKELGSLNQEIKELRKDLKG